MKKSPSEKLSCAKQMPALKHKSGNGTFDIKDSEVAQWLIQQPEILQYIFSRVASNGKKPLIKYNPDKGTWQGVDYNND